jgi:hypothetical protein
LWCSFTAQWFRRPTQFKVRAPSAKFTPRGNFQKSTSIAVSPIKENNPGNKLVLQSTKLTHNICKRDDTLQDWNFPERLMRPIKISISVLQQSSMLIFLTMECAQTGGLAARLNFHSQQGYGSVQSNPPLRSRTQKTDHHN